MKAVIAIDSFKGSLSSSEAGEAASRAIRYVFPEADIVQFPLADGGEGRTRMKKLLVGKLDYICITWFIFVIGALAGLKIMEI